jgi:hypothetical protein
MSSLAEYLDGVVRVPLRLLNSDGFSECPAAFLSQGAVVDFDHFFKNAAAPITGIVTPDAMMKMLRMMGVTLARFRETRDPQQHPLRNETTEIGCLVGTPCLLKARAVLGDDFECLVRVHCIPTGKG